MFEPKWTPTTYKRFPYAPHNSTEHDERCSCPSCMPDELDMLSEEEAAQLDEPKTIDEITHEARMADEAEETESWEEEWERLNEEREAMESFNAVPSYVERYVQPCLKCEQPMPNGPYRGCLCKTCWETPSAPAITEVVIIRGK